ncbi:hypothetical protein [Streptomyces phage Verabelle]|uniref:Uncharacterized protein n=1 Tax=Streptomyces phage Verabelle TaxID=3065247 RepID=A0AA50ICJ5_9CAUD|nr:hypothetical protein [Streptomyces phage Verabelle]
MAANCESCGQKIKAPRTYNLNPSVITALGKLYAAGGEEVTRAQMKLTNTEYSIFAWLAWWGLAEHGEGSRTWSITKLGLDFFEGRVRIPFGVIARDGVVLGTEGEMVHVHDALPGYLEQVAA